MTNGGALDVRGLHVRRETARGDSTIVSRVDLKLEAGATIGIVGESGSGKSITAKAIIGLLPEGFRASGEVLYGDRNLLTQREREWREVRGREIGLIMQDPFTILNPVMRCGRIIEESLADGKRLSRRQRRVEAARRLAEVGINDPIVADRYPFQLSGGMRQRVAIAAALARDPEILIADEPSTALDASTQREILALIKRIQLARGMSMILITHDLRVAFSTCEQIYVMYAGSLMEVAPSAAFEDEPLHPYSQGLLLAEPPADHRVSELVAIPGSVPSPDAVAGRCPFAPRCQWAQPECEAPAPLAVVEQDRLSACLRLPEIRPEMRSVRASAQRTAPAPETAGGSGGADLLTVTDLHKRFHQHGRASTALDGVSLQVQAGESVAVVGESGSGKTTLARMLVGIERPSDGEILIEGIPAANRAALSRDQRKQLRSAVQIVFQDPYSTLNPMRSVGATLGEAVTIQDPAARRVEGVVGDLLDSVGLPSDYAARRPSALSGGERQRVSIARALAMRPRLLICDEPVSALDVSVQAQILNLLTTLRSERGLAYLFITHDLSIVRQIADRVYVIRRGQIVESGTTDTVLDHPTHPYTTELLAAVPRTDGQWLTPTEA